MKDIEIDSNEKSEYECFSCGKIVIAENRPSQCPDCAGEMRNRQVSVE
ncbi:rubrerythrin-like domain-containing protein [Halopenitus salinus]|uniref:Rubrerythrin-like domain-containing protein n=1 Tax=Halopenitus salinus TaxID=1198295 RepID=A0ABD5UWP4_9EURY